MFFSNSGKLNLDIFDNKLQKSMCVLAKEYAFLPNSGVGQKSAWGNYALFI